MRVVFLTRIGVNLLRQKHDFDESNLSTGEELTEACQKSSVIEAQATRACLLATLGVRCANADCMESASFLSRAAFDACCRSHVRQDALVDIDTKFLHKHGHNACSREVVSA
jgi:hypothetical protein